MRQRISDRLQQAGAKSQCFDMDGVRERKRRKWDVAAPQGVPVQQGATPVAAAPAVPAASASISSNGVKPGQPLDAAAIARAQQGAAAVMQKISQASFSLSCLFASGCV